MKYLTEKLLPFLRQLSIPFLIIIFSMLTHGINMLKYPYFLDDEGIYMSQAWSFLTEGKLSPYTYFYDHAPLGWIQIAFWNFITGGPFAFGFSINSGRILMLLFHCFSTFLLYRIAKKINIGKLSIFIIIVFFSFSPISIYFHRWVLLDNIMVFWLLLSFTLLLEIKNRLSAYFLSALCFGIAVLTKETAIFVLPAYLYFIYSYSHKHFRIFSFTKWIIIALSIISLYPLYALLKGEFFPYDSTLGDTHPHVSLLESVYWQMFRKGGNILSGDSQFQKFFTEWFRTDPVFLIVGCMSIIFNLIVNYKNKIIFTVCLFALSFIYYLARGGIVIQFYIIPLIPFLGLSIGIFTDKVIVKLSGKISNKIIYLFITVLIPAMVLYNWPFLKILYTVNHTDRQVEAVRWIGENIPQKSVIVVDGYAYLDLIAGNQNNYYSKFTGTQMYWKVDNDPEIKDYLLHGDWKNIDYFLSTNTLKFNTGNENLVLIQKAFENSDVIKQYSNSGWDIEIRKVNKE